ncbi:spermatogenesis-associated serine-rich protein 2-like [Physella acuta]|uniref:spermatogenesis-associated serine-rich protein 2-like n=1 Tax=Physella acuta TaxID=109671 RepID=UPI0027DB1644|nr:spermatogenesis-associated serine-rich protein 2-like [Physella acuta]
MARKNNSRSEASGSIHFDTRTKAVMAEATQDNIKEKVQAVREVVPGKSNNDMVMVLQYYDYNVEKAIQAFLEDGAKEALKEWNFTGTKPNKKRKNKKKANGEKAGDKPGSAPPAGPTNAKGEPLVNGKSGLPNGDLSHNKSDTDSPLDSPLAQPKPSLQEVAAAVTTTASPATSTPPPATSTPPPSASDKAAPEPLPQRQKGKGHGDSHTAHAEKPNYQMQHHHSNRERTASEVSTGSGMGDGHHKKPFQGLEKAIKDLHRQTTSLERLKLVLDHEIDRSYKSVKTVFEELRQGLNSREAQLNAEMDLLKKEASEMLEMRRSKAVDLKRQVDRADRLKDNEVSELRAEIKHFVSERRHDEELGRATRFLFDSDHMLAEVKKFGEVVPVKSMYTARRASISSVASSSISHDDENSHSQEANQLHDRLKNSLKLSNPSSPGPAASAVNDTEFSQGRSNNRRRPPNDQQQSYQTNDKESNHISSSLDVNSNKPASATTASSYNSNSPRGPSTYRNSNTGSPGRGGRGGSNYVPRGGGPGRGRGFGRGGTPRGDLRGRGDYTRRTYGHGNYRAQTVGERPATST